VYDSASEHFPPKLDSALAAARPDELENHVGIRSKHPIGNIKQEVNTLLRLETTAIEQSEWTGIVDPGARPEANRLSIDDVFQSVKRLSTAT